MSRNPFVSSAFRRWWAASMAAGTGLGIQAVTVPLFIRDRVEDDLRGAAIAAVLVAQTLPGAVLALFGGALADRVERRRILMRTYGVASIVSGAYVLLAGLDVRSIWPVFPLAALVGSAGAFSNPARQSLLPLLVARPQIQNGVIFGTMGFMATLQFLGPTVAGFVVDGSGLAPAFAVEVVLLATGAALFAGIRTGPPTPSGRKVWGDLLDGLRYVRGAPAIRDLLLLAPMIGVFFIGPFSVTIPIVVPDVYAVGDKWVGILWGCFGGGVFAGSVALTLRPLARRGLAACLTNIVGSAVLVLYGLSDELLLSAGLLFVWGVGASVFMNYVVALLHENSEPRMIGRVMSMYTLVFFSSMPIGYAQAGWVTSHFGPQVTLVSSGLVGGAIGVLCTVLFRPVRALD